VIGVVCLPKTPSALTSQGLCVFSSGTVRRISRLLALAHHIQELIDTGQVRDLAEVARLGHITRARMTQIMNLLLLAPDIQEEILFLPRTTQGGDQVKERSVRVAIYEPPSVKQRHIWGGIRQGVRVA